MKALINIIFFSLLFISGCNQEVNILNTEDENVIILQTGIVNGRMAFVGQGGTIGGIINPDLVVKSGTTYRLILINQDGMPHDLSIPELGIKTPLVSSVGHSAELSIRLNEGKEGTPLAYFCSVSGHRQAGMEGKLLYQLETQSIISAIE